MTRSEVQFDKFKKFVSRPIFLGAPNQADIIEFSNFLLQLRNQRAGNKTLWLFYYFYFERNYDVLKSKNIYFLWNKNVNFNKTKAESYQKKLLHTLLLLVFKIVEGLHFMLNVTKL